MSLLHKRVNYLVLPGILLIACNQIDTKVADNEEFIGSPKVALERPEELLCQKGWVIVSYDVIDTVEIVNVHVLDS